MARSIAAAAAVLVAAAVPAAGALAQADAFPSKPLRFIVGVAPGGGTDFAARLMGTRLTEKWGQPVVTDNRTGATGIIAFELTAKAPPDGYTYIVFNIGHVMSAALSRRASVDTAKDFTPVALIATGHMMLAVHPSVPVKSVTALVQFARGNPGKLNYGSGGPASMQHMAMELFKREAGIELQHVPYKGSGPLSLDLLAGQVQATITNMLAVYPHAKAGRLTALAVSSAKRNALAAEVPTMAEAGFPTVDVNLWQGVLAPARTPQAVVSRMAAAIAEGVRNPDSVQKLATQGAEPSGLGPKEFGEYLANERARWLKLARDAKISVE